MKHKGLYTVAALLFAFLMLTFGIRSDLLLPLEDSLFRAVSRFRSPPLTALAVGFSTLGGKIGAAAVCVLLLALPRSRKSIALPVTVCVAVSTALNPLLKLLFRRGRPERALWLIEETNFSFPSGHAMTNAALYAMLAILACSLIESRRWRILAVLGCVLAAFCIGLSRVYLGVHYGGDILGGWLFGTSAAFCVYYFLQEKRRGKG